jgi:hypothetical protein
MATKSNKRKKPVALLAVRWLVGVGCWLVGSVVIICLTVLVPRWLGLEAAPIPPVNPAPVALQPGRLPVLPAALPNPEPIVPVKQGPQASELRFGGFSVALPGEISRSDPMNDYPVQGNPEAPNHSVVVFSRANNSERYYVLDHKVVAGAITLKLAWPLSVSEAELRICALPEGPVPGRKEGYLTREEMAEFLKKDGVLASLPHTVRIVP